MKLWSDSWPNGERIPARYACGRLDAAAGTAFSDDVNPHLAWSDLPAATRSLLEFLQERWKGVWPILYGDQLRQARLDDWIFQGLLDVEHLPA